MEKHAHPRLLYDGKLVGRLRRRIAEDPAYHRAWSHHLEDADRLLGDELVPEAYADSSESQHGNYGKPANQMARMGLVLGLAYQLTGKRRYAQKLRDALLHYGAYRKWFGKGLLRRNPPWNSELNTAQFCFGFAVGYDALGSFLSPHDRAAIAAAVTRLGILPILKDWLLPDERVHALDSMGHNWWSVCVAQAGLAALAVMDQEPQAKSWAEEAARGLEQWFAYKGNMLGNKSTNFDDQGAFYESVHYANYALAEYLLFRLAYTRAFGIASLPPNPWLEKAGRFFLHTCYPTSGGLLSVNFGDGPRKGLAGKAVSMLLANGYADPALGWYLQYTPEAESLLALLYADGPEPAPPELERSVLYPEIGWAVLRSSWEKDATLLAVKCGFTWNHAHADAGSFMLFHAGRPLIIDSGNCSYDRPEYRRYYVQSQAHNVVLFNGAGQEDEDHYRGVKHPGRLHHLIADEPFRYLLADATGPMSRYFSRNYRHFLWFDRVILLIDDIRAHEPGTIEWLLHYEDEAVHAQGAVIISNGPARAEVRPLFPQSVVVTEREGLAAQGVDRKVSYFAFAAPEDVREVKFITAITLFDQDSGKPPPSIAPFRASDVLGVTISDAGRRTDVYFNLRADGRVMHQNSHHTLAGWETDALLLALTRPEGAIDAGDRPFDQVEHAFIGNGSYLRRDGRVLFDSLSKAFLSYRFKGADLHLIVQGQRRIEPQLRVPAKPARVICNGRLTPFHFSEDRQTVRLTLVHSR